MLLVYVAASLSVVILGVNIDGTATGSDITALLIAAATTAGQAPSIHNTQPWRWRIHSGVADLYADTRRQLGGIDWERRLMTISCGAALHHARVALAAAGVAAEVNLLPSAGDPFHLVRLTPTGPAQATDVIVSMYEAIPHRHTDRRPLLDQQLSPDETGAVRAIVKDFDSGLYLLDRKQVEDLAAATTRGQQGEMDDIGTHHELDAWTGELRLAGAGVPDAAIPAERTHTIVPSRDFGHVGTLPVTDRNDFAATYAILYGHDDRPVSWIHAGEALSAMWLYATSRHIALLPISAAAEQFDSRQMLHRILGGLGSACLAVRLGIADPDQPPAPGTPRLPASVTVTT
jgi:nitroreductase